MSNSSDFDSLKITIEKQIIVVLDFLLLDKQIETKEVSQISKFVLSDLDKTQNPTELYSSFFNLLSKFPILSSYLQKTFNSLEKFSNG